MIVRHTEAGWEVIYQSAHALLAGRIATYLKPREGVRFWAETIAAIIDHDDLKESFGKNAYLTDLGAPKDFTQFKFTARERFTEAKRRIQNGDRKHRWIGLLAARHVEALYAGEKISQSLATLIQSERIRRASILKELKAPANELEEAYDILQWCDRTSLILCQAGLPAMNRRLEIVTLRDGTRYEIWAGADGQVMIEPWPFQLASVDLNVDVRVVRQLTFASDLELEERLDACPVENRYWKVVKP